MRQLPHTPHPTPHTPTSPFPHFPIAANHGKILDIASNLP
ncbi:hypothetical protein amyaer_3889 [Microcystis aeruginosa NIES-2481]|nr:hypothetical protein amyaer_3889 [Microcystis aeruginosa NIES-2481]